VEAVGLDRHVELQKLPRLELLGLRLADLHALLGKVECELLGVAHKHDLHLAITVERDARALVLELGDAGCLEELELLGELDDDPRILGCVDLGDDLGDLAVHDGRWGVNNL